MTVVTVETSVTVVTVVTTVTVVSVTVGDPIYNEYHYLICRNAITRIQVMYTIYLTNDPSKRTKFSVRQMHNVSQRFKSVAALRSAMWHKFGDAVPDEGKFSVGYFELR